MSEAELIKSLYHETSRLRQLLDHSQKKVYDLELEIKNIKLNRSLAATGIKYD